MAKAKNVFEIFATIIIVLSIYAGSVNAADYTPPGPQNMRSLLPIFNIPQLNLSSTSSNLCFGTTCFNSTNIGTAVTTDNTYMFLSGTTLTFNQTRNNATIRAIMQEVNQTSRVDLLNATIISNNQSLQSEITRATGVESNLATNISSANTQIAAVATNVSAINNSLQSLKLNTTDNRFNESGRIDSLNSTILSNNQSLQTEITNRINSQNQINGSKLNSTSPTFTGTATGSSITTETGTSSGGNAHITLNNMTSGFGRFKIGLINTETGGNNNGSDFRIWRYNDSGNFIATALTIKRDTGLVSFGAVDVPWNNLTGFPSACPSGWVSTISGTITCTALTSLNALLTVSGYNVEINSTLLNRTITSNTGWTNQSGTVTTPHNINTTGNLTIGSGAAVIDMFYNSTSNWFEMDPVGSTLGFDYKGPINSSSYIAAPQICINGSCQTSWPSGTGTDGTGGWTNTSSKTTTTLNVGIGTAAPESQLDVVLESTSESFNIVNNVTSAFAGSIKLKKYGNSTTAMGTAAGGDELGNLEMWAWNGTNLRRTSLIQYQASNGHSSTNMGTSISLYTTPRNDLTLRLAMLLAGQGIYIGNSTSITNPSHRLVVDGYLNVTGLILQNNITTLPTCSASIESAETYNFTAHKKMYCNSTAWVNY